MTTTNEDQSADVLAFKTNTEQLAWYRATFDDDQAPDDLVLSRLDAWMEGRSLGPFARGVPLRGLGTTLPPDWRQVVAGLDVDPQGWIRVVLETSENGDEPYERQVIAHGDDAVDMLDTLNGSIWPPDDAKSATPAPLSCEGCGQPLPVDRVGFCDACVNAASEVF